MEHASVLRLTSARQPFLLRRPGLRCLQEELGQVKAQLASRGDEVAQLQKQLTEAQSETQDLKSKYGELSNQAKELSERLSAEVDPPPSGSPVVKRRY